MRTGFILTTLFVFAVLIPCDSQVTYSKIYNFDIGWGNLATNFIQTDDGYVVSLRYACYTDTVECSTIVHFDNKGEFIDYELIKNFYFGNNNAMWLDEDIIVGSGHWYSSAFNRIDILSGKYPSNDLKVAQYLKEDGYQYWNNGILKHLGHYYTYGDSKKEGTGRTGTGYASIVKWDSTASRVLAVWRYRHRDGFENHCYQLQAMPDGNLVFRNDVRRAESPKSLDVITIIDTLGNIIKNIEFKDLGNRSNPKLILDRFGNYYLNANFDPRLLFHDSRGGILKLNANNIDWHMIFPFDVFTNERQYYISDFHEASNGDILTCGSVWDQDVSDSIGDNVGFIARVSPEGALLWLKLYKIPNELYPATRGYYRPAFLKQIEETPSGQILCIGGANQREINGSFTQELWILSTDSNGCVEGYDCDSIIILNAPRKEVEYPFVHPANRWHELNLGARTYDHLTTLYRVSEDSVLINQHYYHEMLYSHQEVGVNWQSTKDHLRNDGQKVWLNRWNRDYLLYDFGLNVSDTFKSKLLFSYDSTRPIVVTNVDSITLMDGVKRKRLILKCDKDGGDWDIVWIEGIGDLRGSLESEYSCAIDAEGTLMCFFQNDELLWKDTIVLNDTLITSCFIWTTSTTNPNNEQQEISLYPNPVHDILRIQSEELIKDMVILDQFSHVIQQCSNCREIDLSGIYPGVYYLKVRLSNDQVTHKKFVKVE